MVGEHRAVSHRGEASFGSQPPSIGAALAEPDDIRARLEAIADELADMALARLRASVEEGADAGEERRLTRARRSVEKAVQLLQPPEREEDL